MLQSSYSDRQALTSHMLNRHTPRLSVCDARGRTTLQIDYCRASSTEPLAVHRHRHVFNAAGQGIQRWDPRLDALRVSNPEIQANELHVASLSGRSLAVCSVDSGWGVSLANGGLIDVESWDSRGTHKHDFYDHCLRLIARSEAAAGSPSRCWHWQRYGTPEQSAQNLSGRLTQIDDPAGRQAVRGYNVNGQPAHEQRNYRLGLETLQCPYAQSDLESNDFPTHWRYGATGEQLERHDARMNISGFEFNVAGQLALAHVTPKATASKTVAADLRYNAYAQRIQVRNGACLNVQTHSAVDNRLQRSQTTSATQGPVQDLHYRYDAVGNVERITDQQATTQWFKQQKVQAIGIFAYDTLYRLTQASGRESAKANMGPALPEVERLDGNDASRWRNYWQTYAYDAGGNLTKLEHRPATGMGYTRVMAVAADSNRSVYTSEETPDVEASFDACGNVLALQDRQLLQWDFNNQLSNTTQVSRPQACDDAEYYRYDAVGQRQRKVRITLTSTTVLQTETLYLPGLEIHRQAQTLKSADQPLEPTAISYREDLHVMALDAGGNSARLLHWANKPPPEIGNDQLRCSITDHLHSHSLELDESGSLLSQETYYPFGGTAWWAAQNETQASYKTLRYNGKERDASGLYYYGARYYAPWLQRWLNPDPAGAVDGLNRYLFCGNNPMNRVDPDGRMWEPAATLAANTSRAVGAPAFNENSQEQNSELPISTLLERFLDDEKVLKSLHLTVTKESLGAHETNFAVLPGVPHDNYSFNDKGMFERRDFAAKTYRAVYNSARNSEPSQATNPSWKTASVDFNAVPEMISGAALIVAETLAGAVLYAGEDYDYYDFYEIDTRGLRGASLNENRLLNRTAVMANFLDVPNPSNPYIPVVGKDDELHEAHIEYQAGPEYQQRFRLLSAAEMDSVRSRSRSPSPPAPMVLGLNSLGRLVMNNAARQ